MDDDDLDKAAKDLSRELLRLARGAGCKYRAVGCLFALYDACAGRTNDELADALEAIRIPGKFADEVPGGEVEEARRDVVLAALHVAAEHFSGPTIQARKADNRLTDAMRRLREVMDRRAQAWLRRA